MLGVKSRGAFDAEYIGIPSISNKFGLTVRVTELVPTTTSTSTTTPWEALTD
jgi:hypothetical protein